MVKWSDFYKIPKGGRDEPPKRARAQKSLPSLKITSPETVKYVEEVNERTEAKEKKKAADDKYAKDCLKHKALQEKRRKQIAQKGYGEPKLNKSKNALADAKARGVKVKRRL